MSPELAELLERNSSSVRLTDVNPLPGCDGALHIATLRHNREDVKLLVKHGADVNAKGEMGITPLHYAATFRDVAMVEVLMRLGADASLRNEWGQTAREVLERHRHELPRRAFTEMKQLLDGKRA